MAALSCANGCARPALPGPGGFCHQCVEKGPPFPDPEALSVLQLEVYELKIREYRHEVPQGSAHRAWRAIRGGEEG